MTIDIAVLIVAPIAVFIAGVSKGGFASGASFVAVPLLTLVVDPIVALGLMLPLLMIIDVAALKAYWRRWNWSEAARICVGAVPGILIATLLHRYTNPDVFRFLIGAIAILFVVYQFAVRSGLFDPSQRVLPDWAATVAGGVGGFTSFVSHAGGPPIMIYMLTRKLPKIEFQATTVLVFWVINLVKLPPYIGLGFLTADSLWAIVALAPVALLGVWVGVHANRLIPERLFFALTYTLLVLAGSKLILDAVT